MRIHYTLVILCMASLFSCTKYRVPVDKNNNTSGMNHNTDIGFGTLRINEFICKGINSSAQQHFEGSDAKWFELYNTSDNEIVLNEGLWYVTDSLADPTKYKIPLNKNGQPWRIPSKGFIAILCLKTTSIPCENKINANFSLNSVAGDIGLFYQANNSSEIIAIDTLQYTFSSGALSGISYGLAVNGTGQMTQLNKVTPEASN